MSFSAAQSLPQANPARPTISTPATLPPVGYLQFETGALAAWHSGEFSSRLGINEVAKIAVTSRVELFIAGEPLVHSRSFGSTSNDISDAAAGAQFVLHHSERWRPTIAASYAHHIYTGSAPDLDIGTPENAGLILFSGDPGKFHYDFNIYLNDVKSGATHKAQIGQSISVTHPLRGPWSLTGELWHLTQPLQSGRAAGTLWAFGYTPRPNLVFDFGFDRGLTSTSTRWQAFAGFTYLLPHRLW